jgi:RimJ/RimL family protein N-acetyltransferase
MANAFTSQRLTYRAVENTPADANLMHRIQSDYVALAASDSGLLKPMTREESGKHRQYVAEKTLLGVIICLPNSSKQDHQSLEQESAETVAEIDIGSIYLTAPRLGNEHHRNSHISLDILAAYQNKGYGTEAINWILQWGFQMAGLHRIGIETFSYNEGAQRLYQKLGFVLEGRSRESLWYDGKWHDYLSFSMLEHEWRARRSVS